ncbi:unnamed protein product [Candida verbasci]|uniref:Uncharacterized protein n=1 Tax=Candida verbasci TaxID=1227364 RepID=A0A9W4XAD3_9ASCO|nr:unnamed protein product [Candida verbasci]
MEKVLKGLYEIPREVFDLIVDDLNIEQKICFLYDQHLKSWIIPHLLKKVEVNKSNANVMINDFHQYSKLEPFLRPIDRIIRFKSIKSLVYIMNKYKVYPEILCTSEFGKLDERYIPSLNKIKEVRIKWGQSTQYLKLVTLLHTRVVLMISSMKFSDLLYLTNIKKLSFGNIIDDINLKGTNSNLSHLSFHKEPYMLNKLLSYYNSVTYLDLSATWLNDVIYSTAEFNLPISLNDLYLEYFDLTSYSSLSKLSNLQRLKIKQSQFPIELFNSDVDYFNNMLCFSYSVSSAHILSLQQLEDEERYLFTFDSTVSFPNRLRHLEINCTFITIDESFKLPSNLQHLDLDVNYNGFKAREMIKPKNTICRDCQKW